MWRTDTPLVEGFYWWKKKAGKVPCVVELVKPDYPTKEEYLLRTDVYERVTYGNGLWWYPKLEEPPE